MVDLQALCASEKAEGRAATLFKNKALMKLCDDMRRAQGWCRGERPAPPTKASVWAALLRMEKTWCRNTEEDGPEPSDEDGLENYGRGFSDPDHHDTPAASQRDPSATTVKKARVEYGGINVDPILNIPDTSDVKRVQYVEERKRPQVLWMLSLIREIARLDPPSANDDIASVQPQSKRHVHLVDIGGGRGDLANAVAAFVSQAEVANCVDVHVTVIDNNKPSLDDGKQRATDAGVVDRMSFVLCDVSDATQVSSLAAGKHLPWYSPTTDLPCSVDLVFGLHCCGGLSEAAVELAVACQANFCVCTCCFCSNQHLASLSRRADSMYAAEQLALQQQDHHVGAGVETPENNLRGLAEKHKTDREVLQPLAVTVRMQGQHRAIRALNAMRLAAAREAFDNRWRPTSNDVAENRTRLRTHQRSFPVSYSVQNRVMVGTIERR